MSQRKIVIEPDPILRKKSENLEKVDNELRKLLADQGVKDIIDNSISREEAQTEISKFLNK